MGIQTKEAVSVAEMSRMVGLSRARFYQLIGSAFPHPVYNVATRRPFSTKRRKECALKYAAGTAGLMGSRVMFYCRHAPQADTEKTPFSESEHGIDRRT